MDEITYTTFEAAKILGVNESTIRRRCVEGKLPGAYLAVIRCREIWMIPAAALGLGGEGGSDAVVGPERGGSAPQVPALRGADQESRV